MGYLNNQVVTIDAILTKKGRELMAKNDGSFQITQFSLGDDEIDYTLYNPTLPSGSSFYGEAIDVFNYLIKDLKIISVFSYQETGIQASWKRDKKIKYFCNSNQINWEESQRDGIIRGIKNRDDWNKNGIVKCTHQLFKINIQFPKKHV